MAASVTIEVRHRLGRAEALRRIRERAEALQAEHRRLIQSAHAEWGEATGLVRVTAIGQIFTGKVVASDTDATVTVELPFLARFLSERLRGFLQRQVRRTLKT